MAMFQVLNGFREFYPEDCAFQNFLFSKFRLSAEIFGFEEYNAPILEPTELFTAKSGEEIVSQLFNFQDKGGREVAMRPEATPSLARMVGEKASAMRKPIKWFTIAEAFRYERPQKGRLRSFYQFNVDIFGDPSCYADAEVISLAVYTLKELGLTEKDFHVRLSDRNLWALFIMSQGILEEGVAAVLTIIDKIERESPEQVITKLNAIKGVDGTLLYDQISRLRSAKSLAEIQQFFNDVCFENPAIAKRIAEFSDLLKRLDDLEMMPFITIDFSIVRGLAYYTGFVFELFERSGKSRALAGGGRYDHLVKKLGYNDLPAVGLAIGDVTLGNLLREKGIAAPLSKQSDSFIVYSEKTESVAMHYASQFRNKGIKTEYLLEPASFSKQLKTAAQSNAKLAIIFGENEAKDESAIIKNMATGEEKIVPFKKLL